MATYTLTTLDRDGRIIGEPERIEPDYSDRSAVEMLRDTAYSARAAFEVELHCDGRLIATARYEEGRGLVTTGLAATA